MKIVRAGLYAIFAFAVLAHGTVEPWSEAILEIGAAVLFLIWSVVICRKSNSKLYWSPLNVWILGFIGIGVAQLIFRATVYPFLTRAELLKLAAYFLIFFLTAQAFRERAHMVRLGWFLIFFCFAVSLLGIIQHFTADGKIYWFREPVSGGDTFGPYVNRNHFAGFVELVLPVGLALLVFRGVRRDIFPMTALLTIIPIGALILSGSRGGIVGLAFELGVLGLLAKSRKGPEGPRVAALAMVGLAAVALIVWLGTGKVLERFASVPTGDVLLSRRVTMFRSSFHIFLDHPIKGTGLGTLVAVYPRYETGYDGKVVDHAHNDYVETLAETGMLGGICGLMFLWVLFREARKKFGEEQGHFSRGLHAAGITAVSGLLLHSLVDFNMHIPSNALLFLLLAHLATSPAIPSEGAVRRRRERVPAHTESSVAG